MSSKYHIKVIELSSDKKGQFQIIFENLNENLIISAIKIENSIEYYLEENLSLDKIKQYKYFSNFKSIDETLDVLIPLMENEKCLILEEENKINLKFILPIEKDNEIIFEIKKTEKTEKEIINKQKLIIQGLSKDITYLQSHQKKIEEELIDLKEKYEVNNSYNFESEINIKFESDINLIVNKYLKICELKKLIRNKKEFDKFNINNDFVLIFCGQKMDDKTIINDYPILRYKKECIIIKNQNEIGKNFGYGKSVEIKVIYNNIEKIFCVEEYNLKKYLNMQFQVPEKNQLLYLNGKYRIIDSIKDIYIKHDYIKLEYINDYTLIKIYILYQNNKWPLLVNRISNKNDLLYFLSKKNYFKLNEKEFQANFLFDEKKVNSLMESNIINGDEISLEILPSFESIKRKCGSDFFIFYKNLCGHSEIVYCSPSFTILELKLLIEENEGIYYKLQRLIINGRQLEDNLTMADYKIKKESTLHLVLRLRG